MTIPEVRELLGIYSRKALLHVMRSGVKYEVVEGQKYVFDEDSVYKYLYERDKRKNIIYARMDKEGEEEKIAAQIKQIKRYCAKRGYPVHEIRQDVGRVKDLDLNAELFKIMGEVAQDKIGYFIILDPTAVTFSGYGFIKKILNKHQSTLICVKGTRYRPEYDAELLEEVVELTCQSRHMPLEYEIIKTKFKRIYNEKLFRKNFRIKDFKPFDVDDLTDEDITIDRH